MTAKAERTREHLVDTALALFRERGYQATTMREIATRAGVSQGSAYYYFDGKDAFVQELSLRIQAEHRERALPRLRAGAPLRENLRSTLHAGLDTMAPYHSFGSTMLHVALSRASAVSPFSADSTQARTAATALMRQKLTSSRGGPSTPVPPQLPDLLWLAHLAVTLHWVTDTSPGQRRSRDLVDGVSPIIARTVALSRVPGGRALATDVFALMDRLSAPISPRSTS